MRLCCIGLNHRTASLGVRERFAVPEAQLPEALRAMYQTPGIGEVFVLSTCNRFECYVVPASGQDTDDAHIAARRVLSERAGASEDEFDACTYVHFGRDAARHLFRVASSLDSMVLGETQVLGQVKAAWQVAQQEHVAGAFLHRLVARAFRAAKRVRTETGVAEGGVSISWVAVQLARRIFDRIDRCHVLLLGAGEMAELAALHLHEQGARSLTVANRTLARAEQVAGRRGWRACGLDDVGGLLKDVDIVVASTGSAHPIVGVELVKRALRKRGSRPLFIIDIAVPRDIEPGVGDIDGVYLYNIDDLQAVADRNRDRRAAEAHAAEEIVRDEVEKFANWIAAQATSPVIAALRQRLMDVRDHELGRSQKALGELAAPQREAVERLTEAMISKIASGPIARLKCASNPRDIENLTWALRELFGLADLALLDAELPAAALEVEDEHGASERVHAMPPAPGSPLSATRASEAPQQRRLT